MTFREMRVCCNPPCTKMVMYIKGSRSNEYCSYRCRSAFSPVMRRVCADNMIDNTPEALRDLIREMRDESKNNLDTAVIFGIGTKTLRLWCQKLGV